MRKIRSDGKFYQSPGNFSTKKNTWAKNENLRVGLVSTLETGSSKLEKKSCIEII